MSVGIGALCGSGTHALLSADAMMTFVAEDTPISTNSKSSKLYRMSNDFSAAFADDSRSAHAFISHLDNQLKDLNQDDRALPDKVKAAIENSLDYVFMWMRGEVLRDCGITEDEWLHDSNLLSRKRREADRRVRGMEIPVEAIVVGFSRYCPIMFSVQNKKVSECNDYVAIGSGAELAYHWLNLRGHNAHLSVPHAYYHIREAKRFAELDPFVGKESATALLTYKFRELLDPKTLPPGQPGFAQRWWQKCGIGDSGLVSSPAALHEFEEEFGVSLSATPVPPQT